MPGEGLRVGSLFAGIQSAGSISVSSEQECTPPGKSSRTPTASPSSPSTSPTPIDTRMCERSEPTTSPPSISFAGDFLVRTSASPAREPGSTESARVFGPSSLGSLASFDPATSSWKTSQLSLETNGLDEFSETWPRAGSMRSGTAYLLRPLAPLTAGTGSGLWPTPKVATNRTSHESITREGHWSAPGLEQAAELSEGILPREVESLEEIKSPAARALWPTPKATDADRGGRGDLLQTVRGNESPSGHFKTPTAAPFSHGGSGGELHKQVAPSGGPLNPQFVAWLMGFPIDWASLLPSETPWSRRSRSGSGDESSTTKRAA